MKAIYTLRFADQERVGGREAQMVFLEPKDEYRYLYKLWLDKEYGLILKMSIMDHHQKVIEQASFNQISLFSGQNLNWFKPHVDTDKKYIMDEASNNKVSHEKYCTIANLPTGYREVSHVTRMMANQTQPVPKGEKSRVGETQVGSSYIFARVMNGNQIMVVGEVPQATIKKISNSIQDIKAH
jgi:sigma-E factor negative regulatory protein RseB